jgi:hypothetical protein
MSNDKNFVAFKMNKNREIHISDDNGVGIIGSLSEITK